MKAGERFFRDEPEKYIAIKEGQILRGYSVAKQSDLWRLIVKVTDKRGNHMVAFITAGTIYECFEYWYLHYTTTSAPLRWTTDRYAN